jgi:hypothetical protein
MKFETWNRVITGTLLATLVIPGGVAAQNTAKRHQPTDAITTRSMTWARSAGLTASTPAAVRRWSNRYHMRGVQSTSK